MTMENWDLRTFIFGCDDLDDEEKELCYDALNREGFSAANKRKAFFALDEADLRSLGVPRLSTRKALLLAITGSTPERNPELDEAAAGQMHAVAEVVSPLIGRLEERRIVPNNTAASGSVGAGHTVGSCVYLHSRGMVVTALHAVVDQKTKKQLKLDACFPSGAVFKDLQLQSLSATLDCCLMKPSDVVGNMVAPEVRTARAQQGARVVAMSYPLVIDQDTSGTDRQMPASFVGYIAKTGEVEHVASYMGFPNSSGGGVFNVKGELVGVHTGVISGAEVDTSGSDQAPRVPVNMTEASVFTDIHAMLAQQPVAPLTGRISVKRSLSQQGTVGRLTAGMQSLHLE